MAELTSHHKERYGQYVGNPRGRKPDPARCAEEVCTNYHFSQCARKRGHGPEGAFCKQHDPAAKQARDKAANRKYELNNWNRYGRSAAKAAVGQALLDHLDQKCTFDDVVKAAEEFRAKQREIDELKAHNEAQAHIADRAPLTPTQGDSHE